MMRILTSALIIGVLFLVAYLSWTSEGPETEVSDGELRKEKPILLKNPVLSDFEDNQLTMKIHAKTARVFEKKKLTLLSRIDGKIYSKEPEKKPTRVFADLGSIKGKTKLLTVWGNVRVLFADGQTLYTERMNLDQKKELLYNDVKVLVISEDGKVHADRMRYKINSGVLILSRPKAWIDTGGFQ